MNKIAIVCCPGTTLKNYDDSLPLDNWPRIVVNSAIRGVGKATHWVITHPSALSDGAGFISDKITNYSVEAAMEPAKRQLKKVKKLKAISIPSAVYEVTKELGITKIYWFGLDCYCEKGSYYFDETKIHHLTERRIQRRQRVRDIPERLFVTPKLENLINRFNRVAHAGEIGTIEQYCVGSEYSQQKIIQNIDLETFQEMVANDASEEYVPPPTTEELEVPKRKPGRPKGSKKKKIKEVIDDS